MGCGKEMSVAGYCLVLDDESPWNGIGLPYGTMGRMSKIGCLSKVDKSLVLAGKIPR